jgi:hypothetical protein
MSCINLLYIIWQHVSAVLKRYHQAVQNTKERAARTAQ